MLHAPLLVRSLDARQLVAAHRLQNTRYYNINREFQNGKQNILDWKYNNNNSFKASLVHTGRFLFLVCIPEILVTICPTLAKCLVHHHRFHMGTADFGLQTSNSYLLIIYVNLIQLTLNCAYLLSGFFFLFFKILACLFCSLCFV